MATLQEIDQSENTMSLKAWSLIAENEHSMARQHLDIVLQIYCTFYYSVNTSQYKGQTSMSQMKFIVSPLSYASLQVEGSSVLNGFNSIQTYKSTFEYIWIY